jgi:hypothetical protein
MDSLLSNFMQKGEFGNLVCVHKKYIPVSHDQTLTELNNVGTTNLERKVLFQCGRFAEQRKNIRESFDYRVLSLSFAYCIHIINKLISPTSVCFCRTKSSSPKQIVSNYCDDLIKHKDYKCLFTVFSICPFDCTTETLEHMEFAFSLLVSCPD